LFAKTKTIPDSFRLSQGDLTVEFGFSVSRREFLFVSYFDFSAVVC
jgi:hypothetical protein